MNKKLAEDEGKSVQHDITSAQSGIISGILLALLIGIGFATFIIRSITKPLAIALEVVNRLSVSRTVSVDSSDELGEMLGALNRMQERIRKLCGRYL